jgi:hypothetical protein
VIPDHSSSFLPQRLFCRLGALTNPGIGVEMVVETAPSLGEEGVAVHGCLFHFFATKTGTL